MSPTPTPQLGRREAGSRESGVGRRKSDSASHASDTCSRRAPGLSTMRPKPEDGCNGS